MEKLVKSLDYRTVKRDDLEGEKAVLIKCLGSVRCVKNN